MPKPGRQRRSISGTAASILAASFLLVAALVPVSAAAPDPALGSATVDGDPGEWTTADHFTDMTDNGEADGDVLATLSLRYDCDTSTLYALVMASGDGRLLQTRPDQAYLRIDGTTVVRGEHGDDGTPPDFAWVGADGEFAAGFEASASVDPGTYTIRAHVLLAWDDSDGYLTLDTVPREAPLTIVCAVATPSPTPTPAPTESTNPTPTPTPAPTESTNPTPTPTGSVEPSESTNPTPSGSVAGATGTPRITLPPTDIAPAVGPTSGGGDGLRLMFLGLAALMLAVVLATPARTRRVVARARRQR